MLPFEAEQTLQGRSRRNKGDFCNIKPTLICCKVLQSRVASNITGTPNSMGTTLLENIRQT